MICSLSNFLSFLPGFLFTNFHDYCYQPHFEQTHSENMTSRPSNYLSLPPNSTVGDVSKLLNNDHPSKETAPKVLGERKLIVGNDDECICV